MIKQVNNEEGKKIEAKREKVILHQVGSAREPQVVSIKFAKEENEQERNDNH